MYVATYMSWSSLIIYFLTYESSTCSLTFNEHGVALLHPPSLFLSQSCETYAVPRPGREERRRWEEGGEVERKKRKAGEGIKASKKRVCINYNSVHEVYIYSLVEVNPKY